MKDHTHFQQSKMIDHLFLFMLRNFLLNIHFPLVFSPPQSYNNLQRGRIFFYLMLPPPPFPTQPKSKPSKSMKYREVFDKNANKVSLKILLALTEMELATNSSNNRMIPDSVMKSC